MRISIMRIQLIDQSCAHALTHSHSKYRYSPISYQHSNNHKSHFLLKITAPFPLSFHHSIWITTYNMWDYWMRLFLEWILIMHSGNCVDLSIMSRGELLHSAWHMIHHYLQIIAPFGCGPMLQMSLSFIISLCHLIIHTTHHSSHHNHRLVLLILVSSLNLHIT